MMQLCTKINLLVRLTWQSQKNLFKQIYKINLIYFSLYFVHLKYVYYCLMGNRSDPSKTLNHRITLILTDGLIHKSSIVVYIFTTTLVFSQNIQSSGMGEINWNSRNRLVVICFLSLNNFKKL